MAVQQGRSERYVEEASGVRLRRTLSRDPRVAEHEALANLASC